MEVLPNFIFLKSNAHNKFLRYSKKDNSSNNNNNAFLLLSDQSEKANQSGKIEFQCFKFEVEKSKTVEGLVHIRTCYNNKYWARKSADADSIVAEANEPEEDQSKWSCTLFKPIFLEAETDDVDSGEQKMRLLHVGQRYIGTSSKSSAQYLKLVVAESVDSSDDFASVFTVKDATSVAILPEYVVFMGPDGKYLAATSGGLLEFMASGIAEAGVAQRISYNEGVETQTMSIFDHATGRAWHHTVFPAGDNLFYVLAQTPIWPLSAVKVGNYIALKSTTLNRFANSMARSNAAAILGVSATTISDDAMLRVGEPVRIREITDATYDLDDSRIYNTSNVEKYTDSRSNYTSIQQSGTFEVEYKVIQTMTWNQEVTVSLGIAVSWSAGIPFVGEFGLDISYDRSETWEWGESRTEEKTIKYTQTIAIPPGKKVSMKVVAMKAYCDVPFTCKVRDLMTDGTLREYTKTDGLYVGSNEFQFNTEITEVDL